MATKINISVVTISVFIMVLWKHANGEMTEVQSSMPTTMTTSNIPRSVYIFHYTMTSASPTPSLLPVSASTIRKSSSVIVTTATISVATISIASLSTSSRPSPSSSSPASLSSSSLQVSSSSLPQFSSSTPVMESSSFVITKPALRPEGGQTITISVSGTLASVESEKMEATSTVAMVTDSMTTVAMTAPVEISTLLPDVNTTYLIVFDGNCTVLKTHDKHETSFKNSVQKQILIALKIEESQLFLDSINCGSVNVPVTIYNTRNLNITQNLQDFVMSGNLTVIISTGDNNTFQYTAMDMNVLVPPGVTTAPPENIPTQQTKQSIGRVEKIIIIVVCIVVAACLFFGIFMCFYECRKRKNSKSFTLGKTPGLMTLEDFTLTKMRRPQPVYSESGVILSTHFVDFTIEPKERNNQTLLHLNENVQSHRVTNGHVAPFPGSSAMADIEEEHVKRSSTENLVGATKPPGSPGYDNPSFSSDDILDSGTEADATEDLQHDDVSSHEDEEAKLQTGPPLAGPSGVSNTNSIRESSVSSRWSSTLPPTGHSAASSDSGVPAMSDTLHPDLDLHSRSPSNQPDSDLPLSHSDSTSNDRESVSENRPSGVKKERLDFLEHDRASQKSRSSGSGNLRSHSDRSRSHSPKSTASDCTDRESHSESTISRTSEQKGLDLLDAATQEYSEREETLELSDEAQENSFLEELNMTLREKAEAKANKPNFHEETTPF